MWSTPTATIYSLPRTSSPYYFRIRAVNGTHAKLSPYIGEAGLRPGQPSAVTASGATTGTVLNWRSGGGTRLVVARATNLLMTADRFNYGPTTTARCPTNLRFVAPHLANPSFSDSYRQAEAENVLSDVARYNPQHLPVVCAGDFDSDVRRSHIDVPGNVMKQTLTEASAVAQTKYNSTYDSYNQYRRTPPQYGLYLDRIFVSPGVGVRSWVVIVYAGVTIAVR